jgi:hypothetical protein
MAEIHSAYVSQVAPLDFSELSSEVDASLPGTEVVAGKARLRIHRPGGRGFADARYFSGTLRTGSPLVPVVKVELVVSPWSAGRTEIGLRPLTSLGQLDSFRSDRFYNAARRVLSTLIDRIEVVSPTADAELELVAA